MKYCCKAKETLEAIINFLKTVLGDDRGTWLNAFLRTRYSQNEVATVSNGGQKSRAIENCFCLKIVFSRINL